MTRRAVLINDTLADSHYGCFRVVHTIERLASENGISIIGRSPVHTDWRGDSAVLSAIDESDIVLVNGEGTIHHDCPAARRLVAVADHCAAAGKPTVLLNASWSSNSDELARSARNFSIISARESESERELQAAGLTCRRMADLALYGDIAPAQRNGGIGVTDSVRRDIALDLDRLRRSCGGKAINIFYGRSGLSGIRFFLRAFGVRQALGDPLRLARTVRAAHDFGKCQMPAEADFIAGIARLGLLITGRFHAAIFSLASLTPLLAVESSTPKISATLADAGVEPWRARTDTEFDVDLLRSAARWHGDEESNIRDFLSDNRTRQAELFKDISSLAA